LTIISQNYSLTYSHSYFLPSYQIRQDVSQELRSALEEKAKKQGGQSGGAKRTGRGRKMKPGQAKTLSDLPVLNT
jgi:hypothetical protein